MRYLALLLAAVLPARAIFVIESVELDPGYTDRDRVEVHPLGVLTLKAPGIYTAPNWVINGELRLGAPGTYTVVASTGSIVVTRLGSIRGPQNTSLPKKLTFAHAGDFSFDTTTVDTTIDISQGVPPVLDAPPLVNLSTRATLASGQSHVAGFVVGGNVGRRVLVRAVGPALASFGVANALATPVVTVYSGQTPLRTNSGWGGDPGLAEVFPLVGAFALPATSRDAALVMMLNPGSYTVQVGGGAGEVLVEIYYLD